MWRLAALAARQKGGPTFRVLVHHKLSVWQELAGRVGLANAQQFWDHVARAAASGRKFQGHKGKHHAPKWPGYPKTIHYEITGAGRINYQFNPSATDGADGVVKIMSIDLGSH